MCCAVSIAEFARRLPSAGSLYTCRGRRGVREIVGWALFVVILAAVAGVAHLGIGTSSWVDLALVAERMAMIAALAVSVLVKVGPAAGL